jgi:RHS repeat-associated protein
VSGVVTRFIWRGGHIVCETANAGTLQRSYTWGIGADDLVAITDHQDGNRRYYVVQDQIRSVRGLVERTGSTGTWRAAWRYTPYGESFTTDGGVNFTVRFRWAGAMLDEETGLYFLRTRSYDPRFGRFIQADVIGFSGGGNLYAYAGDPTTGRDPDGMVALPEPQYITDDGRQNGAFDPFAGGGSWGDDVSPENRPR